MISTSSDSCSKLVAGKYDVLLDDNPALIKETLDGYLERFGQLEADQSNAEKSDDTHSQQSDFHSYAGQFKQLRELSKTLKTDKESLKEGELDCNKRKNRYQDIIPFNHTRVVLKSLPGIPGSEYINANFIRGSSGSPKAYIACQGPLKATLNDFWRMIWECNVSVIIMACNQFESGQLKCELYWPELPNTSRLYGHYLVTLVKVRQICDDFLIRKFSVKLLQTNNNESQASSDSDSALATAASKTSTDSISSGCSEDGDRITRSDGDSDSYCQPSKCTTLISDSCSVIEERTICQFHYTTWPDHGVPQSVQPILELLRLVRDVQPAEDKPILVHCSAGCGRTGTICCIDYVWGLLRRSSLDPDFDLHHIISEMRRQRMSMVQTLEQYILCHRAVAALFADQLSVMLDDDQVSCSYEALGVSDHEQSSIEQEDIDDDKAFDDEEEDYGPVFI